LGIGTVTCAPAMVAMVKTKLQKIRMEFVSIS
jgi:hypothetical protein